MENVIALIGLLLFCPPTSLFYFVFENSKNTRKELARPVMGTIFLVYYTILITRVSIKYDEVFHV